MASPGGVSARRRRTPRQTKNPHVVPPSVLPWPRPPPLLLSLTSSSGVHLGQADDHKLYDLLRLNALPLVPRDPKAPLFKLLWESLPPPPQVLAALAFEVAPRVPACHSAHSLWRGDSIELSSGRRGQGPQMNFQKKLLEGLWNSGLLGVPLLSQPAHPSNGRGSETACHRANN